MILTLQSKLTTLEIIERHTSILIINLEKLNQKYQCFTLELGFVNYVTDSLFVCYVYIPEPPPQEWVTTIRHEVFSHGMVETSKKNKINK